MLAAPPMVEAWSGLETLGRSRLGDERRTAPTLGHALQFRPHGAAHASLSRSGSCLPAPDRMVEESRDPEVGVDAPPRCRATPGRRSASRKDRRDSSPAAAAASTPRSGNTGSRDSAPPFLPDVRMAGRALREALVAMPHLRTGTLTCVVFRPASQRWRSVPCSALCPLLSVVPCSVRLPRLRDPREVARHRRARPLPPASKEWCRRGRICCLALLHV